MTRSPTPDHPAITIAIPAHNEEAYLGPCLDAVITDVARETMRLRLKDLQHRGHEAVATTGRFEILVVDNASTDGTARVAARRIDAARAAGAELRVVSETRKGLTRARQCGQREARGDIVAWVDADTEMPAGWLERVDEGFSTAPGVVCVSGPYRYLDQPRLQRNLVRLYWRILAIPSYWFTGYLAVGGNFAVRRDAIERIGGFDESIAFYGEDTNIARRLSEVGKVVFDLKLEMPTSARRFAAEGMWRTAFAYVSSFVSEVVLKRPVIERYRDIR